MEVYLENVRNVMSRKRRSVGKIASFPFCWGFCVVRRDTYIAEKCKLVQHDLESQGES